MNKEKSIEIRKGPHSKLFSKTDTLEDVFNFLIQYPDYYNTFESDNGLDEFKDIRITYSRIEGYFS